MLEILRENMQASLAQLFSKTQAATNLPYTSQWGKATIIQLPSEEAEILFVFH